MSGRGAYQRRDGLRERRLAPHLDLWFGGRPVSACPEGMSYFRNLGFEDLAVPVDFRFHPDCSHPSGRTLPAILCPVHVPAGSVGAVYRIYVHGGALADVQPPRATLGRAPEGAIRMWEPRRVPGQRGRLLVVTGVERALAARIALAMAGHLDVAVWATTNVANIAHCILPVDMQDVVLLWSSAVPGVQAAIAARMDGLRHSGRVVRDGPPPAHALDGPAWDGLVRTLYP